MMLTVGSLFSGIGGIDLGLERAGMKVLWQVENDAWCQKILTKHWPEVPKYDDVQTVRAEELEPIDVLAGGFPCQDLSVAGKQAGICEGTRSGLWTEFARLIRALRPRYVFVENVPGLLIQPALGIVFRDLAECGYDAEWQVLSARAFGANHLRKRVWIVAYPRCTEWRQNNEAGGCFGQRSHKQWQTAGGPSERCEDVADASQSQQDWGREWTCGWEREPFEALCYARQGGREEAWMSIPESLLGRVADGIPHRVHRLRGLGNAVVPQVVEWIGKQIVSHAYDTPRI